MFNKALAPIVAGAILIAAPSAHAVNWSENVKLCSAAAEAEGLVTAGEYKTKFLSGGGGSTKKISIKYTKADGESVVAVCKVRRGKVSEIKLKA